ncbi:MAG: Crp/Fnr family transcriptional regulator [Clostridiales bacterium]|nr:Crp/Fnr family transcriptional regulator [Clostridiales bacterium]
MTKYLPVLKKCPLFVGIEDKDIDQILPCLSATVRQAEKNTFILSADDSVSYVGLILTGSVHVIKEDFWGRKDILSQLGPAELFAESFSCAHTVHIPVSVLAVEQTEIMLIDCRKIIKTCSAACLFHNQLISNMLEIIANKNIMLMQKIEQLSKRTTREKVLAYLSAEAQKSGKNYFDIPFSRQEMADYLSVDRSAMSSELSKMRDEGLIDFERNHFKLISEFR